MVCRLAGHAALMAEKNAYKVVVKNAYYEALNSILLFLCLFPYV